MIKVRFLPAAELELLREVAYVQVQGNAGTVRGQDGQAISGFREHRRAKLAQLHAAQTLEFLRSPPGNRLEALGGDRKGQHSIRVNDQWRLCFVWTQAGPTQVEIVDYH